jgi:hypothetical protein
LVTSAEPTLMTSRRAVGDAVVAIFRVSSCWSSNRIAGKVGGGVCRAPRLSTAARGSRSSASCNWLRQFAAALAADRADAETVRRLRVAGLQEVGNALLAFVLGDQVKLVEDQPAWPAGEFRIVLLEFTNDGFGIATGRRRGRRRQVDDVQQQAGACEVLEEADAQAGAFGRAIDQPGMSAMTKLWSWPTRTTPRCGSEGGERVIGDLRTRRRDGAQEGALAGVGQAEQADIGEQAQFEPQFALLAGLATGALARRAIDARLEMDVAEAASATFGQQHLLAVLVEVGKDSLVLTSAITVPTGTRSVRSLPRLP